MLNTITIMGRLVRNPELRTTQSGVAVCSITVACERDFNPAGGERGVDYIDCTAWRGTAEFINKHFSKGSMIVVSGGLRVDSYKDREGQNKKTVFVNVDNVYFAEAKRGDNEQSRQSSKSTGANRSQNSDVAKYQQSFTEMDDDDGSKCPF